ncbi:MAG: hypothetical protein IJL28_10870 [Prevotella sp.]|nr:hypothetical protein [Prevotella sp.]
MKENITYPLNAIQWECYEEFMQAPELTQHNVTLCMPFERSSAQRFQRAMQRMLDEQRYLHIHLVRQGDDIMICEDWQMPNNVHYYRMSDAEWEAAEPTFTKPFDIFNEACVHLSLIETDSKCYVVMENHHLFFDGISQRALWNAFEEALQGKPLYQQGDIAAEITRQEIASYDSDAYRRAREYYLKKFEGLQVTDFCRETDNPLGPAISSHPMVSATIIDEGCQRIGQTPTTVFYAAYALALAYMSGERRVAFYTFNHGRGDRRLTDHVYGHYLTSLPIMIDTDPGQTVTELLNQAHRELFCSMRYRIYPEYHLLREIGLDDGAEMGYNASTISEYINIDGKLWNTYHIDPSLTGEHSSTYVTRRDDLYEVFTDCSSALYTQQQIDTLSEITGQMALRLVGNQEETISNIIFYKK